MQIQNAVFAGDARTVLERLPRESVHLTVTSPPYYNARAYSQYPSYGDYLEDMEDIFHAVAQVTKEGRFLAVNTSPVIEPREKRSQQSQRFAVPFDLHARLQRAGWEFLEDLIWVKPEGSAKNRIAGFAQHRKPLTWKPNIITEYVMIYRKKTDRLIDWNLQQYGKAETEASLVPPGYETTNVWRLAPAHDETHPAVYPEALCSRLIRYYAFAGDLVLDPFAGTGTTGLAAARAGRDFLLIEKEPRYLARIRENLGGLALEERQMDLGFLAAKPPRTPTVFHEGDPA